MKGADSEENEGRRRTIITCAGPASRQRGEAEQANEVFEQLIQRAPTEPRYAAAAEAMLSASRRQSAQLPKAA